ncbi:hypothetical protein SCLCIDRAFT_1222259, partial [Scleroderma citrinum Foug A]
TTYVLSWSPRDLDSGFPSVSTPQPSTRVTFMYRNSHSPSLLLFPEPPFVLKCCLVSMSCICLSFQSFVV